jgi:hypothetical protein
MSQKASNGVTSFRIIIKIELYYYHYQMIMQVLLRSTAGSDLQDIISPLHWIIGLRSYKLWTNYEERYRNGNPINYMVRASNNSPSVLSGILLSSQPEQVQDLALCLALLHPGRQFHSSISNLRLFTITVAS